MEILKDVPFIPPSLLSPLVFRYGEHDGQNTGLKKGAGVSRCYSCFAI
jgi:hypothetical protein